MAPLCLDRYVEIALIGQDDWTLIPTGQLQVIGGRWKPLHYLYKNSIYTDVALACGGNGLCYIKNDSPFPFSGKVIIYSVTFASGAINTIYNTSVTMATGAGVTKYFTVDLSSVERTEQVLVAQAFNKSEENVCNNVIPLLPPMNLTLPMAEVTATVIDSINDDGTVDIEVKTDKVAMYVVLTTLAQGRFSDNAFLMLPGSMVSKCDITIPNLTILAL
jgi:hypothetical protein